LQGDSDRRDDQFVSGLKDWLLDDILEARGIARGDDVSQPQPAPTLRLVTEEPVEEDELAAARRRRDEAKRQRRAA
jgi:hypothetical protein